MLYISPHVFNIFLQVVHDLLHLLGDPAPSLSPNLGHTALYYIRSLLYIIYYMSEKEKIEVKTFHKWLWNHTRALHDFQIVFVLRIILPVS